VLSTIAIDHFYKCKQQLGGAERGWEGRRSPSQYDRLGLTAVAPVQEDTSTNHEGDCAGFGRIAEEGIGGLGLRDECEIVGLTRGRCVDVSAIALGAHFEDIQYVRIKCIREPNIGQIVMPTQFEIGVDEDAASQVRIEPQDVG
jgi:hypothetical protein